MMPQPNCKPKSNARNSPREWLFIAAICPLLILLGFHVAGLAILARKHMRIPYIVGVSILMAGLSMPLVAWRGHHPIWIPLTAILFIQVLVVGAHAIGHPKEQLLDGGNLENIAPAHLMLCVMFLLLPAVYAARDAYNRRTKAVTPTQISHTRLDEAVSIGQWIARRHANHT